MNFSPGPWNIDKHQSGEIYDKHSRLVATVNRAVGAQKLPYLDNAKLIAAAPSLLTACLIVREYERQLGPDVLDVLERALIRAGVNSNETVSK